MNVENDEKFAQYIKDRYEINLTEFQEEFSEEYRSEIHKQYLARTVYKETE